MPEDHVVVVPVDILQSLLQEVQQLRGRVEALEGRADGIDNWTEKHAEAFAYVAQKVRALEASQSKDQGPYRFQMKSENSPEDKA